jgi:hypothetical protein
MKLFPIGFLFIFIVVITSCTKSEFETPTYPSTSNKIIQTNITENTTWYRDTVYQLSGRISVSNGATLTIESGTIIKGESGTGANASLLLISKGSKLIAEGTEFSPIIFTSVVDELTPDHIKNGIFNSPNLNPTISGLWGGVILLGEAPISASNEINGVSQTQIEGIPTSDFLGRYGGVNSHDYSGVLRYVSIRHGGANIGAGNEINGLTLGGVGSNTLIDNIEIVANQDDGIEFFGGTVNITNAIIWNVGDDAIDADQSWSGVLDNFVIISPQGHCFELDGPEGSLLGSYTIKNGKVMASNEVWDSMDLINTDDNTRAQLENISFFSIKENQKVNRTLYGVGSVTFTNIWLNLEHRELSDHIIGPTRGFHKGEENYFDKSGFEWTWAPI